MIFHIGDAVELLSSTKRIPTEGDYKVYMRSEQMTNRRVGSLRLRRCGKQQMEANGWNAGGITLSMILFSLPGHLIARGEYVVVWIHVRELFETDHISNNPVESIVDKVSVVSPSEWESLSEEEKNHQFFCEFIYSFKTTYIHPIYGKSIQN